MVVLFWLVIFLGCALVFSALTIPEIPRVSRPKLTQQQLLQRQQLEENKIRRLLEYLTLWLTPKIAQKPWAQTYQQFFVIHLKRLLFPFGLLPIEWVAVSIIAGLVAALIGLLLFTSMAVAAIFFVIAFLLPLLYIRSQARRITYQILKTFPDFLDTVTLLLEAGLDFLTAVQRYAISTRRGVLGHHLVMMVHQLQSGDSLLHAVDDLDRQLDIAEFKSFFAALQEALRVGGSLVAILRVNAQTLREQRFERAEKKAAEAAVKVVLPLLMIFAAVLLIVIGPMAVQIFGGF